MRLIWIIVIFVAFYFANISYAQSKEEGLFINRMVRQYKFRKTYLESLFSQIQPNEQVLNKIKNPYEAQPWYIYWPNFITKDRINDGVLYWKKHAKALKKAEEKYGVPPEIIVAIIGIESNYGMAKFKYPVLNSLFTLSFYYEPRASYFQHELSEYLLLAREQKINPHKIYGSYAGAIGLPQFMPSSYREFAVSYGKHNSKNIIDNTNDVIMSVANYLHSFGWHRNEPVAVSASVIGYKYRMIFADNAKPALKLAQLAKYGVFSNEKMSYVGDATLLQLEKDKNSFAYWLIFHNFYSIMHYNSSKLYAMTVCELAKDIKSAEHE